MSDDNDHPPFDAPWQAEVFALVVALNESGHLVWSDWVEAFSRQLAQSRLDDEESAPVLPARCGTDGHEHGDQARNTRYWRAWRLALESICRERQWAGPLQLGAHREVVRAFRRRVAPGSVLFKGTGEADG